MSPDEEAEQAEQAEELGPDDAPVRLHLRRAPRYQAFGITGAVVGVAVGLVLALSHAATGDYSMQSVAGYFAAGFGLLGVLVGLGAALLAERRGRRSPR